MTQIAGGRASKLNRKLNDEIIKRISVFKDYGILCAVDYAATAVVLHFDVTRFRLEGDHRPRLRKCPTGNRSTSSLAPSQKWLSLLHDLAQCTRSPKFSQRRRLLPRAWPFGSRCRPRLPLAHPPRRPLHDIANGEDSRRLGFRFAGDRLLRLQRPEAGNNSALPLLRPAPAPALLHDSPHAEFAK